MRTPRRRRPGLLSEPGRGFCQYLPLFTQHPYLAAQPIEFFALGRGQAVAAQSFIESSLLDPLADRLNCRFEFTPQRGDAAPAARQFNDSTPVFCCVWWMRSGHLENSFSLSPTPSTKLGQLQDLGPNHATPRGWRCCDGRSGLSVAGILKRYALRILTIRWFVAAF